MKKIIFLIIIIIILISATWITYTNYKVEYNSIQKSNQEFEYYYNKQITGTELTTIINKAIDLNTKNKIQKDGQGKFIANDKDSINIDIKMLDNDNTYPMEIFYNNQMEKFIKYYGVIEFKCTDIKYHKDTGKIKYLYFEQISK